MYRLSPILCRIYNTTSTDMPAHRTSSQIYRTIAPYQAIISREDRPTFAPSQLAALSLPNIVCDKLERKPRNTKGQESSSGTSSTDIANSRRQTPLWKESQKNSPQIFRSATPALRPRSWNLLHHRLQHQPRSFQIRSRHRTSSFLHRNQC
jgi:hypothetical protein